MSALLFRDVTAELEKFLENEIGSVFCVPWLYGEKAVAALTAAGLAHHRLKVAMHQFVIDALCITYRDAGNARLDEAITCVYGGKREVAMSMPCIGERQFHPLLLPKEADVRIYESLAKPVDAASRTLEQTAIGQYRKLLETLSRITGRPVRFYAETSGMRQPIWQEPEALHLITNSCPPGYGSARYVQTVFGRLIHAKGHEEIAWGPTPGRGTVLKDEDGQPTVQMLGNTWYLLVPTISTYHAQNSVAIFERLLGQAWAAHLAPAPAEAEEASSESFGNLLTSWVDDAADLMAADVRKAEERIAKLQEGLVAAHRNLKDLRHFVRLAANPTVDRERRKRAKEDWEAVKANPLVKGLTFADDGIHVETVPIHLSQDGQAYDLGTFTVRLAAKGQISIWCEKPKQYKGYPHPHINDVGHPCFGNAGTAITQAMGEMRFADAVRYMLRWLTEGYTPALTEIKLETWPRVGESDEAYGKRMGLHQIDDPDIKERRMTDAEAAVWKVAVEMIGTMQKDPKLDAILADPPGFVEAPETPEASVEEKEEEKNDDASAQP